MLAQQVREASVKRYGEDPYLAILSLNNLASRYQGAGRMRQPLALFEEARNGIVPRLGADHPTSLNILDNLARVYRVFRGWPADSPPLRGLGPSREGRQMADETAQPR